MSSISASDAELKEQAWQVFEGSRRQVDDRGRLRTFHCPSTVRYPFQWLWDSCFHAIALTHYGEQGIALAKEELRALFSAQRRDGFLPHVIFWFPEELRAGPFAWHRLESQPLLATPRATSHIQPPVYALAVQRVLAADDDAEFRHEMTPKLLAAYRWLAQNRDPDGDGLISIISPFESGMDYSPVYDSALGLRRQSARELAMRARWVEALNKYLFRFNLKRIFRFGRFQVKDLLVNSIYIQGLFVLRGLLSGAGDAAGAAWADETATGALRSLLDRAYDEEASAFWNLDGRAKRPAKVLAIGSLMPLIIEELPAAVAETLVRRHLANEEEFWLPYPLPSVAANELAFSPRSLVGDNACIWRGSSWVNTNWFLAHGLRAHGFAELGQELARRTRAMVAEGGFFEYFEPYTAAGLGAREFGWTTLVVDLIES